MLAADPRISMKLRAFLLSLLVGALPTTLFAQADVSNSVAITIDANSASTPFPHFWEEMFGSGRAVLSLRDSYRQDLREVRQATGFKYVRFHGIFMDEAGFFSLDKNGKPVYNFNYIDQIYDGLLANGVKPFVELSFMPKDLASDPTALHAFWYKQNVSPPKDYSLWDDMIRQFAQHLVARYGADEVASWYFEVWNEPNIDFWVGTPKQPTYFDLYDHTARVLKKVSRRLRVGGPAAAQAAWAGDFLAHCKKNNVPVDFVSNHVYANDTAKDVFHTSGDIPRNEMVCRSVKMVHDQIAASPYPNLPYILSEYNASYANEPNVTDSIYMGPWMATTIAQCDGLTSMMSYWTFSDVFEEQGIIKTPFYGGFGLMAIDGIPKPAFNVFAALHHLGDRRIANASDSALVTKKADGTLVVALWDYAPPNGTGEDYTPPPAVGKGKHFELSLKGVDANAHVNLWRVDRDHGNVLKSYDAMGRPADLTLKQIKQLKRAGQATPAEAQSLQDGMLQVDVPAHGLVVMEIR
jgi:xylan 1,4-beta-xylosidase